jgi:phage gp36-like protein
MGYTTQADLVALLEEAKVIQGLDDNGLEAADAVLFIAIQTAVDNEIHGYLEGRYAVPIPAPVPALLKDAELVLEAELLWARRGNTGQNNPWSDRANKLRDRLVDIQKGTAPLSLASSQGVVAGGIVSEPSVTHSPGRMPL